MSSLTVLGFVTIIVSGLFAAEIVRGFARSFRWLRARGVQPLRSVHCTPRVRGRGRCHPTARHRPLPRADLIAEGIAARFLAGGATKWK